MVIKHRKTCVFEYLIEQFDSTTTRRSNLICLINPAPIYRARPRQDVRKAPEKALGRKERHLQVLIALDRRNSSWQLGWATSPDWISNRSPSLTRTCRLICYRSIAFAIQALKQRDNNYSLLKNSYSIVEREKVLL